MKHIFFSVGPSQLYPTVPVHIKNALKENIPSLSHRSSAFADYYKTAVTNLRKILLIPDTHEIYFTASALEGMERTIQNTVKTHSFHFVNGSFSREFYQIALDLGKTAKRFDAENGQSFDFKDAVIPDESELITFVQNETSTGVSTPLENIYAVSKSHPDKLIAIDIVSSTPYIAPDFTKIDIALFSVQKGFGLPSGLGVMIISNRAMQKARYLSNTQHSIGSYHNFLKLQEFGNKYQTRETPNVMNIYLLSKVTQDILAKGIEVIRHETEVKAQLLYSFFDNHPRYKPYVQEKYRSKTTIVIDVLGESGKVVDLLTKHAITVAEGYGKRKDNHIRIANFPSHTEQQIKRLIRILKYGK